MNDSATGSTATLLGSRMMLFRDALLSKENVPVAHVLQ